MTARALTPHVRTTEADRELQTTFVVDRSASLDFGTARCEKREIALAAIAAFGSLTVRAGNRLGVLIAGGNALKWLAPRSGRHGVLAALSAVYDTPRGDRRPAAEADLGAALTRIERTQRRRGQVIVVSDFLDRSDWRTGLRRLGLRHQVIAVHVTDPREFELPRVGVLAVVDPETGAHLDVQTNSPALRARYALAAAGRHEDIRRAVLDARAEYLHLSTDRDWLIEVVRFVGRRRGERAHARRAEVLGR